jgi:hypothetical protein
MNRMSVRDVSLKGKRVLMRVDFNVPMAKARVKWGAGVEKLGSKTRFPSGQFLPVRVFLAVVCFLRDCHRWLCSQVEEPHQSFQVLCHGS